MRDAVELERHGVPAVVVVTEPFHGLADATAAARGAEGFPVVVVRHPLAPLGDDDLRAEAERVAIDVLTALTVPWA
ncbi:MAG: hypothetical protein KY469_14330 [Actinobacteria bacterium]|nr:hypothetical protein [Actinomycetota bacterium]